MSKMGEYAASREDERVYSCITIGAVEPIEVGTMVNIPGLGEAQVNKKLGNGEYEIVTTDVKEFMGRETNVFIVRPIPSVKWLIRED